MLRIRVRLFGRKLESFYTRKILSIGILVCLVCYVLLAKLEPDEVVRALFNWAPRNET